MKKTVFWDFDGTLVETNQSFFEALNGALTEQGYGIDKAIIKDFLGEACTWNVPEQSYLHATGELWWKKLLDKVRVFCERNGVLPECIPEICAEFRRRAVAYDYILYEDARSALEESAALGYENYLLSNNFPELIETVDRFGLKDLFCGFFLSSCIGYEKPRKEIFEYALKHAGNPQMCVMVGDNPIADIQGAQTAGMRTIQVHRVVQDGIRPDGWCGNLSEVIEILRKM